MGLRFSELGLGLHLIHFGVPVRQQVKGSQVLAAVHCCKGWAKRVGDWWIHLTRVVGTNWWGLRRWVLGIKTAGLRHW